MSFTGKLSVNVQAQQIMGGVAKKGFDLLYIYSVQLFFVLKYIIRRIFIHVVFQVSLLFLMSHSRKMVSNITGPGKICPDNINNHVNMSSGITLVVVYIAVLSFNSLIIFVIFG